MKKKNPNENLKNGIIVEVNCPNCNMISYIGSVRDGETKDFHCEAGEASCGYTWSEKFKMENVHDYDIEIHRNESWSKTNWGSDDKEDTLETARNTVEVFLNKPRVADAIRVVDREDNILFEWRRDGRN
jgi:hypothetical protein